MRINEYSNKKMSKIKYTIILLLWASTMSAQIYPSGIARIERVDTGGINITNISGTLIRIIGIESQFDTISQEELYNVIKSPRIGISYIDTITVPDSTIITVNGVTVKTAQASLWPGLLSPSRKFNVVGGKESIATCAKRGHVMGDAVMKTLKYCPPYLIETDSSTVKVYPACSHISFTCMRCDKRVIMEK